METKELKIQIPEGYEIDREKSTLEKIVFKKKDAKPRSWEEFCKNHKGGYYFISSISGGKISGLAYPSNKLIILDPENSKHTLPTKEYAEAFLAYMQLMSLRQAWIGNWQSDWNREIWHYCIIVYNNKCVVDMFNHYHRALSFPTKEMAEDFMNCFKDLLNIARPLI